VDISPVAIERLVERSKLSDLTVNTILSDAAQYGFPPESFDLVVLYYHFDRTLFPRIYGALKPGGLFICKLAVARSSGQTLAENMPLPLQKEELLSFVTPYESLSHFEKPVRDRGVVEYLGRKPFLPKNARI
ncbi:MAG TPA: methyltransferase domain-containing protein, partial [Puia sp.]|nr:methyltransferase domain-containing protein [Puia sp.]